jgi:hypothetical protein
MNETGGCFIKQNKPDSKRQILHVCSHMNNLDLNVWCGGGGSRKGTVRKEKTGYLGGGSRPTKR